PLTLAPCTSSLYTSRCPPTASPNSQGPIPQRHSPPTRRSSDLWPGATAPSWYSMNPPERSVCSASSRSSGVDCGSTVSRSSSSTDRKSTRLNSSHVSISYAVFCLNKRNGSCFTHSVPARPPTHS